MDRLRRCLGYIKNVESLYQLGRAAEKDPRAFFPGQIEVWEINANASRARIILDVLIDELAEEEREVRCET